MGQVGNVKLRLENTGGVGSQVLLVDVLTHSHGDVLATLALNKGFPEVTSFYARQKRVGAGFGHVWCVRLEFHFNGPIPVTAQFLSVNVMQDRAVEYTYPWFGVLSADQMGRHLELDGYDEPEDTQSDMK